MEKVENSILPEIEIYFDSPASLFLATSVGYGIEEEGLPYRIKDEPITYAEAYDLTRRAGLGVTVLVTSENVAVFTRQLKVPGPLFDYRAAEGETARTIGKNAARLIKNKPFLELAAQDDSTHTVNRG